jgi:zinc protease
MNHYRPDTATLVVLGAFDPAQAKGWVERYFGAVRPTGGRVPRAQVPAATLAGTTRLRLDANVVHQLLSVTWPVPGRDHADFPALEVAAHVLAESLTERLRDRDRTASVAEVALLPAEHGSLFWIDVLAREQRLAENFLPEVDRHIQRMRVGTFAPGALERALRVLRRAAARAADELPSRALALARSATTASGHGLGARDVDRYDGIDAARVTRAVNAWLKSERRIVSRVTDAPGNGSPRIEVSP